MSNARFLAPPAPALIGIIRTIRPDELGAPTPCAEYDVRRLVNHLLFWGPSLEAAARKQSVPPPAGSEADVDLTEGDWRNALEAHLDRTVAAWTEPGAWEGLTDLGGPPEVPASLIGGMVVGELVVHGWDLAQATGQRPSWDDDLLLYVHDEVAKSVEQCREMGIYGPAVAVPAESSTLDRLLGLTGRDPTWTPRTRT